MLDRGESADLRPVNKPSDQDSGCPESGSARQSPRNCPLISKSTVSLSDAGGIVLFAGALLSPAPDTCSFSVTLLACWVVSRGEASRDSDAGHLSPEIMMADGQTAEEGTLTAPLDPRRLDRRASATHGGDRSTSTIF